MTAFLDLDRILVFTLLLARTAGLVAASPLLGERFVPMRVKALFAGILAMLLLSLTPGTVPMPAGLSGLVLLVAGEAAIGLSFGFVARLLVHAFEMAGHVVAIQMGFAMAQVFDPMQDHGGNLLGRWMWLVGMALFLGLNGHHHLLRALTATLELLPPGHGIPSGAMAGELTRAAADSLGQALRIGAPVIGVLLLTSIGLGILARTVPQMNVFIVGFPIKIAAGIVALMVSLPYLLDVARREVGDLVQRLSSLALSA